MERETWKNLGLVGAAVVAIGCKGAWYFGAKQEPKVVATATPPPRVTKPAPPAFVKPKPHDATPIADPIRQPHPPEPGVAKPLPPKPGPPKLIEKKKPITGA